MQMIEEELWVFIQNVILINHLKQKLVTHNPLDNSRSESLQSLLVLLDFVYKLFPFLLFTTLLYKNLTDKGLHTNMSSASGLFLNLNCMSYKNTYFDNAKRAKMMRPTMKVDQLMYTCAVHLMFANYKPAHLASVLISLGLNYLRLSNPTPRLNPCFGHGAFLKQCTV